MGAQSRMATLIELKLFGSDHMTSESDHENKNFGGFSDQNYSFWNILALFDIFGGVKT